MSPSLPLHHVHPLESPATAILLAVLDTVSVYSGGAHAFPAAMCTPQPHPFPMQCDAELADEKMTPGQGIATAVERKAGAVKQKGTLFGPSPLCIRGSQLSINEISWI